MSSRASYDDKRNPRKRVGPKNKEGSPRKKMKASACSACRLKKKSCSGTLPECERCSKSRSVVECIYEWDPESVPGKTEGPVFLSPSRGGAGLALPRTPSEFSDGLGLDIGDLENPFSFDITAQREKSSVIFRIVTLSHRYQVGILVSCAKEQAIILGDRSGTFIHPVYIDLAQFYGCHTYRPFSSDRSLIDLEAELEKKLGTALSDLDPRDVFVCAQAHLITGIHSVLSRVTPAIHYIERATSIIEHCPHAFIPSLDNALPPWTPLEPSQELQQRFALISHVVSSRSLLRIHVLEKKTKTVPTDVLKGLQKSVAQKALKFLEGPPNGALSSLDEFFGVEFWDANESVIAPDPLTIRAMTMLFAFEARSLIALDRKKAESTSDWCRPAELFVCSLSSHLWRIDETLMRYVGLNDSEGIISVKCSKFIALVALAEIFYRLSFSVDSESRRAEVLDCFLTAIYLLVIVMDDLRGGNDLHKADVYTRFSVRLALGICIEQMVAQHNTSSPQTPTFPHECDLPDCVGVCIYPLTQAYEILCHSGGGPT